MKWTDANTLTTLDKGGASLPSPPSLELMVEVGGLIGTTRHRVYEPELTEVNSMRKFWRSTRVCDAGLGSSLP